jgi:hypothetical protein
MPSTHPDPLYSRAEIGILACSKRGNPMRLSKIEPAAPGYDVHTFECAKCESSERFLVAIQSRLLCWLGINRHLATGAVAVP